MVQRNKAADCLREPLVQQLPPRCLQLKKGYGDCRRGMIDMRKRFRGNWPAGVGQSVDEEPKQQLYAGRPAYASQPAARADSGEAAAAAEAAAETE